MWICGKKRRSGFGRLSRELKKRNMLIPVDIILDAMVEDRADIPLNALHRYSGLKADIYLKQEGDRGCGRARSNAG